MQFTLNHWRSEGGRYERIYINGDFVNDLKIYFHPDFSPGECPRVFGCADRLAYPEPYCNLDNAAEMVSWDALEQHDIDPEDFSWWDLMDVC